MRTRLRIVATAASVPLAGIARTFSASAAKAGGRGGRVHVRTRALVALLLAVVLLPVVGGLEPAAAGGTAAQAVECPTGQVPVDLSQPLVVTEPSSNPLCALMAAWASAPPSQLEAEASLALKAVVPDGRGSAVGQCLLLARQHDPGEVQLALRDCLSSIEPDLAQAGALGGGASLDTALGLTGTLRPTGPTAGAARGCGGARVDSRLAQQSKAYDFASWPHVNGAPPDPTDRGGWGTDLGYRALRAAADTAWQKYVDALEHEADVFSDPDATAEDRRVAGEATKEALNKANDAIEKRNDWRPLVSEGNDGVLPTVGDDGTVTDGTDGTDGVDGSGGTGSTGIDGSGNSGTAVARTVPGFEDPCAATATFLADCAAGSWKSAPCSIFLDVLKGCDTTVMLIDPDQGGACGETPSTVDAETFDGVLQEICWTRVRPAGPGEDPCAPQDLDGAVVLSVGPFDPCNDPAAMRDPDDQSCRTGAPREPSRVVPVLTGTQRNVDRFVATLEGLCSCSLPRPPGQGPAPLPYEVAAWSAEPAYDPLQGT